MNWRFWRKKPKPVEVPGDDWCKEGVIHLAPLDSLSMKDVIEQVQSKGFESRQIAHPRDCECLDCAPELYMKPRYKELEVEITFPDWSVKVTPASKFWETNREWWVGHIPFSDEHPYTD